MEIVIVVVVVITINTITHTILVDRDNFFIKLLYNYFKLNHISLIYWFVVVHGHLKTLSEGGENCY